MSTRSKRVRRRRLGLVTAAGASLFIGTGTGCETWQIVATTVGIIAAVAITYTVIKENEKRKANERETTLAREAAAERRRTLTAEERTAISDDNARLAVVVGESETEQHVMFVDAHTGEPIDDEVRTFPKDQISALPSGESVAVDNKESDDPGAVPPQNVRFGKVDDERVIFRL